MVQDQFLLLLLMALYEHTYILHDNISTDTHATGISANDYDYTGKYCTNTTSQKLCTLKYKQVIHTVICRALETGFSKSNHMSNGDCF